MAEFVHLFEEALNYSQHEKPICFLNTDGFFDRFFMEMVEMGQRGFLWDVKAPDISRLYLKSDSFQELWEFTKAFDFQREIETSSTNMKGSARKSLENVNNNKILNGQVTSSFPRRSSAKRNHKPSTTCAQQGQQRPKRYRKMGRLFAESLLAIL